METPNASAEEIMEIIRPGTSQAMTTTVPTREIDPLAVIEARNKLLDRILDVAIKATHAEQWMDIGGKPYPTGPACEAMARRCAVGMDDVSREKIQSFDDRGEFYIWVYRARFYLPGGADGSRDSFWAEGTCSSRDQFLGTDQKKDEPRPLSEIDEGNIMKAALTNCRNNGITQLLGLRNMSWDRLAGLGIKRDATGKVEFAAGAQGGGRSKAADDVAIKWGNGKGRNLSELEDKDVQYYLGAWKKDLVDPAKEKYHRSCQANIAIAEKLLAARANAKAGTAGAQQQGAAAPSIWARIKALPDVGMLGIADAELGAIIGRATGKQKASELDEADVEKVAAALAQLKRDRGEDIRF